MRCLGKRRGRCWLKQRSACWPRWVKPPGGSNPSPLRHISSQIENKGRGIVRVRDTEIKIAGRFLRVARLDAEKFQFLEEEPDRVVEGLRGSGVRIDLFTFLQKLSDPKPDLAYPMEMDNFAAIPISTFENWWTKQIGFKARNKAKQAEKKGVVLREVPFSDGLIHGIWKIYNEC